MADGLGAKLERFVRKTLDALLVYRTPWPATVVSQAADGTLELRPDLDVDGSERLPGLVGVPIAGLPGVSVKVRPGARVIVEFARGEPDAARAVLFDPASLSELKISADTKVTIDAPAVYLGKTAARGVARLGDIMTISGLISGTTPFTGTAQIATGSEQVLA